MDDDCDLFCVSRKENSQTVGRMAKRVRTVGGNEERRTWAAIVERQQEEIEALKQEVGAEKQS